MRRGFRTFRVAIAVLLLVFCAYLLRTPILAALGNYLVETDPVAKADTVLVLDGDARGQRILTGAQLVRDGFAPHALISGSDGDYGKYTCDRAVPFAVEHGYPESYFIHMESSARSTEEEAAVAIAKLRQSGVKRVLLVTSNFHTRRASGIYRRRAPDITFITISAADEYFTPQGWWHTREGRKTFLLESQKTVANWFGL